MNNFQKKQSKYYDDYNKNVDFLDLSEITPAEKSEVQTYLKFFESSKSKKILDIGCGTGRITLRIAPYFKEIVGIDVSKKSILIANKTAKKYKINNFKGYYGSFDKLPYSHYFDYVIMVGSFHHIDNVGLLLKFIHKYLKPNGKFIMSEFNTINPLFIPFIIFTRVFKSHFNKGYLRSNILYLKFLLKKNNFKPLVVQKYAFFPNFLFNYSLIFKSISDFINKIPIINIFCGFHIIKSSPVTSKNCE